VFAETRPTSWSYSNTSRNELKARERELMSRKKRRNQYTTTTQGTETTQDLETTQDIETTQSTHMYQPSKSIKQKGSGCGCGKKTSR
jgi:hypothetical protein